MKRNLRQTLLPLLTAMIWGAAFSAQSVCSEYLGPFTINALRFFIAFLVLLPVCLLRRKGGALRDIVLGSLLSGTALFAASNAQQFGLAAGASAGKAGFITALYIVLVPLAGVFTKKKPAPRIWLAVAVAVAGMYFLCISGGFSVAPSDLWLLACAALFAVQILAVDHFVQRVDGLVLSCGQFLTAALLSAIFLGRETITGAAVLSCLWPLAYIAVLSSCVGYTLSLIHISQIVASAIPLASAVKTSVTSLTGKTLANSSASCSIKATSTLWFRKPSTLTMCPGRIRPSRRIRSFREFIGLDLLCEK